jgi:hypothetical protein
MSGIKLDITNILELASYISPVLVMFILSSLGLMNGTPMKSIMYVISLIMGLVGIIMFQSLFNVNNLDQRDVLCDLWHIPFLNNSLSSPSISSFIVMFSIAYTLLPMLLNGTMNATFLTIMFTILGLDGYLKINKKCVNMTGYIMSLFLGTLVGGGFSIIWSNISKKLTYFSSSESNRERCGRVSPSEFRCSVYKNGELVGEV